MSIKNSNPFRTGFLIGAAIGFLGCFLQIDAESTPFVEALLNALGFAVVLGLFIGFGFSGAAGRTHSHAAQHTDETDYGKYSKKHPPTTNVVDDKNET
ncbi:hypothetical protein LMJ53_16940 [Rheinheimera sp. UJ51]|uniref:hypothetical protein n=1 Tax=Rheinheimera sp. UJ51 TaxID=2892446 RepID=UPI001E65C403|nr:hypothetical protein [Rheinheimera sp. UJ51]MCC5453404.1 hypothetical protein [Rheinheimera sp. UJ51]